MRALQKVVVLEEVVEKGQRWAKMNKERKIRRELQEMRRVLEEPTWADVWLIFVVWLKRRTAQIGAKRIF